MSSWALLGRVRIASHTACWSLYAGTMLKRKLSSSMGKLYCLAWFCSNPTDQKPHLIMLCCKMHHIHMVANLSIIMCTWRNDHSDSKIYCVTAALKFALLLRFSKTWRMFWSLCFTCQKALREEKSWDPEGFRLTTRDPSLVREREGCK